ncbi:hypothetical protein BDZ45DRAFT_332738 [Acephala macrosclerotiorum]|nr:hypothetical protein BDZ45DRAFT_332738 [Acephala macrosclerotiorum]
MPAIRTLPTGRAGPTKPVKTERTHLENQERAYVAASRRSDRSLEARVESAKRASAIHKQRTGREFKISEQIVQDEEMYEEQDDNMPFQYRGLAAHLQTTDPQFNARLSAFLQTQIGMRDMANSMNGANGMNFSYGYPGATQFTQFPQAIGAHQVQHNQPLQQVQNTPLPVRQTPYPTPRPQQQLGFSVQGSQPNHFSGHHRSMSYSIPKREPQPNAMHPSMSNQEFRRMSMPGAPSSQSPAVSPHTPLVHSAHSTPPSRPAYLSRHSSGHMTHMAISQSQQQTSISYSPQEYFPLTAQLPREAQGLMGSTLDQSNLMNSMMMAGSNNLTSTWFDFSQVTPTASNAPGHQLHPTREGLFSTIAPATLESQETKIFDDTFTADASTVTDTPTLGEIDNSAFADFTNEDFTNEDWSFLGRPVEQ